jgi:NAD+ kinase
MVAEALPLVEQCAEALDRWGVESSVVSAWSLDDQDLPADFDMVFTFGGDGTILRAARWLRGRPAPVVGVQMGRLGFLAEILPKELPAGLQPYVEGDCWLDGRSMMCADVVRTSAADAGTSPGHHLALNDVVVGRGQSLRTVTIDLAMEGHPLHSFRCDGVIVATATGSTAYSFAAGGPILAPESSDLVVTAICPHISSLRSLVVPGDVPLRLQVWTEQPAVITVDGQVDEVLEDGAIVDTRRSDCATLFARRGASAELYSRILSKLH